MTEQPTRPHRNLMPWIIPLVVAACLAAGPLPKAMAQPAPAPPPEDRAPAPTSTPAPEDRAPADAPTPAPEVQAPPGTNAWHQGVSEDDKRVAQELLEQGMAKHQELLWEEAVTRYRQALEHWPEHPRIHLLIARALDKLGDGPTAFEHLEVALRWEGDGLTPKELEHAREMRTRLLTQSVGVIEITCAEPGALVTLDGTPWFTGPATRRQAVRSGEYELVARKPGRFPVTESVTVLAGQQQHMTLRMELDRGARTERRYRPWLPWATVGAGVSASVAGAWLLTRSKAGFERYDEELEGLPCYAERGCTPAEISDIAPTLDRARWQQSLAFGLMAVGGAAMATGAVLAARNRPREVRDKPTLEHRWKVTPVAAREGASLWLSRSF